MTLVDSLNYQPVELAFGTSGLRGLVTDMTDLECYINAAGFLEFLKQHDNIQTGTTVYLAGDLRRSTPRITQVMVAAIQNAGMEVIYGGSVPTPAIAYYASLHNAPCIMVTGSHIPADRNGIKFYKSAGEVLKADEAQMQDCVSKVRVRIYEQSATESQFTTDGQYKELPGLPEIDLQIASTYKQRYTDVFAADSLAGKQVVMYQHSAVGRDIVVDILESLGATVIAVGRSEEFVPIDTENVTEAEDALFKQFASDNPGVFAIVSTDGDSDRPFVIDENGVFYRGDVLGCIATEFLGATFAAVPISANDAVDEFCKIKGVELVHTKIGSPYVIVAMQQANRTPTVGWEVNGGLLLGSDLQLNGSVLKALPTRDAVLPILCALLSTAQSGRKVSETFAALPARFTGGGLLDVTEDQAVKVRNLGSDLELVQRIANNVFADTSFGEATLDTTDGLRMVFQNGEVIHLRASGNAPQVRVYTNASSQERADELTAEALANQGFIVKMLSQIV